MGGRRATKQVSDIAARIMSECTAYRLRIINRAISKLYDDALRPFELRVAQLNTLVVVMQAQGLTPNELSQRMHMDASTVSRNVERMKGRGWLEVVPDEDGRAQPFRLTPQGRKLLEKAVPAWSAAQQQVKQVLGDDIVNQLNRAVKRIDAAAAG